MITYPPFRLFSNKHYVFLKNVTICQVDAVPETLTFSIDNKINQHSKMTQIVLRFNTFSTKIVHHVGSMNAFFIGESAVQKRNCSTFASSNTRTIFDRKIFAFGIRNLGKLYTWNLESWALESGIQYKESGIPLTIGWNPESKFH